MTTTSAAELLGVTHRMFDAWNRLDWDAIKNLFAEDAVLHSVMEEPVVGRTAIAERLDHLAAGSTAMHLDVRSIGVIDGQVFARRVDRFTFNGHEGAVPVVGVLTIANGLVTEWLEYYDRATLLREMGHGASARSGRTSHS